MKTFHVSIRGSSSLLLNRFHESNEIQSSTRKVLTDRGTPREQAEKAAYRDKEGRFYFPGPAIMRLLREAGSNHKMRGSRKSVKFIVPAAIGVMEEAILISNGNGKLAEDFEVDSRPVVIPATKGRIMAHRPRWDEWGAKFTLTINDDLLEPNFVNTLLTEGGVQIGIGSFRPSCGGPYGRFLVESWKELK